MKHKSLFILILLLVGVATTCFAAQALQFNGSNLQSATILSNPDIAISSGTLEAWFKVPSSGAGDDWRGIAVKQLAYGIFLYDNQLCVYDWSTRINHLIPGTTGLNDNTWHHAALTFQSGVANGTNVYLDGVLKTPAGITITYTENTTELLIGNGGPPLSGGDKQVINGIVDEVRVWNDIRTQAEIAANMHTILPQQANLVGYWRLEGNGNDSSGKGHDATLTGSTLPVYVNNEDLTLPVELTSFTATLNTYNMVTLQWITQSETNVSGFRIYRNLEDRLETATQLSTFIPATNTSQLQVYEFTDEEIPSEGTYYYWLESLDLDGTMEFHGPICIQVSLSGHPAPPIIPSLGGIYRTYPNPFNPAVNVECGLKNAGATTVQVFNQRGQLVKTLFSGIKEKGSFTLQWDGTDSFGQQQPSGIYIVRMDMAGEKSIKKVVMSK